MNRSLVEDPQNDLPNVEGGQIGLINVDSTILKLEKSEVETDSILQNNKQRVGSVDQEANNNKINTTGYNSTFKDTEEGTAAF